MLHSDYEYEFIAISIETSYEVPDDGGVYAREDESCATKGAESSTLSPENDANDIPMGESIEEIEHRKIIIRDFFEKWSSSNPERKVYNDKLGEYIYVRAISIIEAKEHSAKSYKSTRAIMIFEEILKNASPIRRVAIKTDNNNQKGFAHMLVMVYKHPDIGTVKLTVGVRQNSMKIQYGLTALRPGQPLINETSNEACCKKSKKRKPHK